MTSSTTVPSRAACLHAMACGAAATLAPLSARAQELAVLRVGATISDFFGEPYYAGDAGAFARVGFRVEPVPLPNAGATTAALAGGAVDLALLDAVTCANAVLRGLPLQMIAGGGMYTSKRRIFIIATAVTGPVHALKDFEGRVIAVPTLGAVAADSLQAYLVEHGVDLAKVKFVEMPQGTMTTAVVRGTIDGALLGEPNITLEHGAVRDMGHPLDAVANDFFLTGWVATKAWAADRDRLAKVVRAIYDTARWANANEDKTLVTLAKINRQDPAELQGMARVPYATDMRAAYLQPVLDMAAKFKLIERPMKVEELTNG